LKRNLFDIKFFGIYVLNIFLLIIFSLIVLPLHPDRMFTWLDGFNSRFLASQQHTWMSHFSYGMNIFEGLGDISFPLLINLTPISWVSDLFKTEQAYALAVYTSLAAEYFSGAYLICRAFQFKRQISLLAAWAMTLFLLPLLPTYHNTQLFYQVIAISPFLLNYLFFWSLYIYCFANIGRLKTIYSVLLSILTLATLLYIITFSAAGVSIAIPFISFFSLMLLIFSKNKFEIIFKVIFILTALFTLIFLHYFQFLLGLLLYTVPAFFPDTLSVSFTLSSASMLFNKTFPGGTYIAKMGLAGAVLTLFFGTREAKKYAWGFLIFFSLLLLFGISTVLFKGWYHGPIGFYYEYLLWPIYMAFSCIFIVYILKFFDYIILHLYTASYAIINLRNKIFRSLHKMNYMLPIILLVTLTLNLIYAKNEPKGIFIYPPKKVPPIIAYLQTHLALKPGENFKGYAATFYPKVDEHQGTDWFQQATFDTVILLPKLQYSYRIVGLWLYNIPTLEEYSPILSPSLYYLLTKTLSRSIDHQIRNILTLTKINIPLLQTLGVKYIITNEIVNNNSTKLILSEAIDSEHDSLYLYEVLNSNIASYSPTQFKLLNNIEDFIAKINANNIDFSKTAYVTTPVNLQIDSLKRANIAPIRNGINLTADTDGVSTVLLPILYSHCLHLKFNGGKPEIFKLQRANLAESLVIFSRHVNVDITYHYGLAKYADCRLQDRKSLQALFKKK